MSSWQRVLVLVDDLDDREHLMDKAARLADGADLEVHVMAVVYEEIVDAVADRPGSDNDTEQLRIFAMQLAHDALEDLIDRYREHFRHVEASVIWNRTPWRGALDAANSINADVIIRRAHVESRLAEILHTPDDWNLLRHAPVPVLLAQPRAWREAPVVMAAVDVRDSHHRDLNTRILAAAGTLTKRLGGRLVVVSAHPMFLPLVSLQDVAFDYTAIRADMVRDMIRRLHALVQAAGLDVPVEVETHEGPAHLVLADRCKELDAQLVVVGTAGREALAAFMIGNTSERLIHAIKADLMTVPARSSS